MEVGSFGLGIRFDMLEEYSEEMTLKIICDELFSVLTLSDVKGLRVHGGFREPEYPSDVNIYMMVFTHGSLKEMRNIYRKLDDDAGINMYFAAVRPYYENNRLERIDGLTYFGTIQSDGRITGGERNLSGVIVSKKRGKRKLAGRGLKIMIAPDAFGTTITSLDAIKRLTIAARHNIPGVKVVPIPITAGGRGAISALTTACNGVTRSIVVKSPLETPVDATYGVLFGKRAIIEAAQASGSFDADGEAVELLKTTSFGIGEIICRVLDEGIRDVVIALGDVIASDSGMGCARALGVKFYDKDGVELTGGGEDLIRIERIDTEFIHPMIRNTEFSIINNPRLQDSTQALTLEQKKALEQGNKNLFKKLEEVCHIKSDERLWDMENMLCCILGAVHQSSADVIFKAMEFEKLLKGVALVVTGESILDERMSEDDHIVAALLHRCEKRRVPVAILTEQLDDALDAEYRMNKNCAVFVMNERGESDDLAKRFDVAADRMFSFIRIGRNVERIGVPSVPKRKSRM